MKGHEREKLRHKLKERVEQQTEQRQKIKRKESHEALHAEERRGAQDRDHRRERSDK
jgi:hypothetical protein